MSDQSEDQLIAKLKKRTFDDVTDAMVRAWVSDFTAKSDEFFLPMGWTRNEFAVEWSIRWNIQNPI